LYCPNLSFHTVSEPLEASRSRAELSGFYSQSGGRNFSQECLDLDLGGKQVNLVLFLSLLSSLGRLVSSVLSIL
jgi:hypothetical protein